MTVDVALLQNALKAAIASGEKHSKMAIQYALRIRDLRLAMERSIWLSKRGMPDKARETLERELKRE